MAHTRSKEDARVAAAYAAMVPFLLAIATLMVIIFAGIEAGKNAIVGLFVAGTVLGVLTAVVVGALLSPRE